MNPSPYKVGLTGGIASGKSTAAELFSRFGTPVIDADQISRELVAPGSPLLEEIIHRFGKQFVDPNGHLNRRLLRNHIFSDVEAKKQLESILHPAIERELVRRAATSSAPYVILMIPLLLEANLFHLVDRILVIDIPKDLQLERLCRRDDIAPDEARRIISSQATRTERLAVADDVLDNSQEIHQLSKDVAKLHALYLTLAGEKGH